MSEMIDAILVHSITGRIRLQAIKKSDYHGIPLAAKNILGIESARAVKYSSLTGSILLTHTAGSDHAPLAEIQSLGFLNILDQEPDLNEDVPQDLRGALKKLDSRIAELTAHEVDLELIASVTLGGLGLLQFSRGQGLPAGLTMMIHAGRIIKNKF